MLIQCAWCGKFKIKDKKDNKDKWIISNPDPKAIISHGLCPDCSNKYFPEEK